MQISDPLVEALESANGHTELAPRAALAIRELVRGNLTFTTAADVAGVSEAVFVDLVAAVDLSKYRDEAVTRAPSGRPERTVRLSVIVPFLNEETNLPVLHGRLSSVLAGLGSHEIVFVDDGSTDHSAEVVLELRRHDPTVKLIRLTRNFGKESALSAGLDHALGDAVVMMDADLQDPPEVLPELVARWAEGAKVVYAVRTKRKESAWKRAGYHGFYRLQRAVAEVDMPLDAGDFCLMDRRVVEVLRDLPEKNRFLRGLRSWAGFEQVGVPYERPVRHAGDAKFTLRKLVKTAADGLMAFTSLPLRLATYLGFFTAAAGLVYLAIAFYARLFTDRPADGWTSLVAIILIVGGSQLLVTGVLGAYVARIYDETKRRPMYVIDQLHTKASRSRIG